MSFPKENEVVIQLPHPYLTPYAVVNTSKTSQSGAQLYQVQPQKTEKGQALSEPLHNTSLYFSAPADVKSSERPPESNNTLWGRARRSPSSTFAWDGSAAPTLGQAWLLVYILFTVRPQMEYCRVALEGSGSDALAKQLRDVLLAIDHPKAANASSTAELMLLRSTFWQGAGSPFGPRSAWIPEDEAAAGKPLSSYPLTPYENMMTNEPSTILTWHPRRPAKPRPGSVIYSRWIPHLGENFSMVALDWQDDEHLRLFHEWQNDPRVSQGWNETGTLEQHREYLRRQHQDPHQITVLARFEDTFFAYFEVYWGKVSRTRFCFLQFPVTCFLSSHFRQFSNSLLFLLLTVPSPPPLPPKTGGPTRCVLQRWRLRPWPALAGGRRALPRPAPRVGLVVQSDALPVPGRPAHHAGGWRAQVHQRLRAGLRLHPRLRPRQVCRPAPQALRLCALLARALLPARAPGRE
jgi:N5-hydroxy-L-ornithine N5-transacylase